jgi:hypothetical protein
MKTQYFINCKTIDEVKKLYKELAMQHHPDRGGDTETMQEINNQYHSIINNPFFKFYEESQENQEEFIKYPIIIDQLMVLENIIIELIGNWIWVSGNTFIHKFILKQIGLFFAPKKKMWYYRPPEYKSRNRTPKTIESIRNKYGSQTIENKTVFIN